MHILIAPDKFKGSLSAHEVARHLHAGIKAVLPKAVITCQPVADGGEGFMELLTEHAKGHMVRCSAHDPLMRLRDTFFGVSEDGTTAYIEIAAISGYTLVEDRERDPLRLNTYGTGELIRHALDKGCRRFIIGLGGSATMDVGMGMATALGIQFTDREGFELIGNGNHPGLVAKIDLSKLDPRILASEIRIACDVQNPLCGPEGAAYVFGPQKGATPELLPFLDNNFLYFAGIIRQQLNVEIGSIPGGGAAGGLGAAMVAFFNAKLENGFQVLSEELKLEKQILLADVIITGEGKIDLQTLHGKAPFGIAQLAKKHHKPVIAVGGWITDDFREHSKGIFDLVLPVLNHPIDLEDAMKSSAALLEQTGSRLADILKLTEILT